MSLTESIRRNVDPKITVGNILTIFSMLIGLLGGAMFVSRTQAQVEIKLDTISHEIAAMHQTYVRRDVSSLEIERLRDTVVSLRERVDRLERRSARDQ